MSSTAQDTRSEKGVSLARGPALILGTVLLVAGLYFLYKQHTFPKLSQFPSGRAHVKSKAFLGIFGVNGWSGELTAAAGGLLLFGAAQHLLAKAMSLIVGVVLAVVAIIALVHHHSSLGLFAANIWTIILWGASAALLLINTLLPRRTSATDDPPVTKTYSRRPVPATTPVTEPEEPGATASPPPATTPMATTDPNTLIVERQPVRVRPSDESDHEDEISEQP